MEDVKIGGGCYGQGGSILYSDRGYFYNVSIRDPRVSTDHQMVLADLRGFSDMFNLRYRRGGACWHITDPKRGPIRE